MFLSVSRLCRSYFCHICLFPLNPTDHPSKHENNKTKKRREVVGISGPDFHILLLSPDRCWESRVNNTSSCVSVLGPVGYNCHRLHRVEFGFGICRLAFPASVAHRSLLVRLQCNLSTPLHVHLHWNSGLCLSRIFFASAVASNLIFYPNLWPHCLRLRLYSLVHLPNSCNSLRTWTFRFFKPSFSTAHPIPFDFEHLFYLPIPLDSFPGQRSDYYFLIA